MNREPIDLDALLDREMDRLRTSVSPADSEHAAIARVEMMVAEEIANTEASGRRLVGCDGFRAMLADRRSGMLSEARRMLLDDHVKECVGCRRASAEFGRARAASRNVTPKARGSAGWSWRLAAAAGLVLAVIGLSVQTDVFSFQAGGMIRVESLKGEAFHVRDNESVPVQEGQELTLAPGERLRTAGDTSALIRLADTSSVELSERSEIGVVERRHLMPGRTSDSIVDLDRGVVVVEAADQGSGHLYVETDDCEVAVQGTIFAVNHGVKGSRVSVIEGQVGVNVNGRNVDRKLTPGEQLTTRAHLESNPIGDEVAFSRNVDEYIELLRAVRSIGEEMDRAIATDRRRSTDLLDAAPAQTAVYFALPNMSAGIGEAWSILRQRVQENPGLRQWWNDSVAENGVDTEIQHVIEGLRTVGSEFGSEIVLTLGVNSENGPSQPLFLADLVRPETFRRNFETALDRLAPTDGNLRVVFLGEAGENDPIPDPAMVLYAWQMGSRLALAPNRDRLVDYRTQVEAGSTLGTVPSRFHGLLAEHYDQGVEWLLGVDLGRLITIDGENAAAFGVANAEFLMAEVHRNGDRLDLRASLVFDQNRRGIAAWLAPPAAMSALDFVSRDAYLAAAFVAKDAGALIDELFEILSAGDPDFEFGIAEFEREHAIDIRRDLAAPIGGEFAIALDGPVVPVPSWKLIVESYDSEALDSAIGWAVSEIDATATRTGSPGLTREPRKVGGRDYGVIVSRGSGQPLAWYTFSDGYLVAGPSQAIVDRALMTRASGVSLPRSTQFTSLLPRDRQVGFSAAVYRNLSPAAGPLADLLSGLGAEKKALLTQAVGDGASLTVAYGEPDRIIVAGSTEGGFFGQGLGSVLGFSGLLDVRESVVAVAAQTGQ